MSLADQKLLDFFDLHAKCPLKIRGKGYSPLNEFFLSMRPQKALPCRKPCRLRHKLGKSIGAFRRRVLTRSEKKLANKKVQLHHNGQTNPLR
jgi:hypothetical protein